jgi:endonuclease/exonuclease/phosphatase family metal-dependent hydrolase
MTWNAFGAGQGLLSYLLWRGVPDAHRFEHPAVREAASEVDVLCMQEVFLSEAERFFDALAHLFKLRDDNKNSLWPLSVVGSGLGTASRVRIAAHEKRAFDPPFTHSDRFARKGMLHTRVAIGDVLVDVVNTHMQSGMGLGARVVRKRQLAQLGRFVQDVGRSGAPMIVCGDLNIDGLARGGRDEYAEIARALPGFVDLGATTDDVTFDTEHNELAKRHAPSEPPQRLDYMFLSDPSNVIASVAIEPAFHVALESAARPRTFASDHYAVKARFKLR